MENAGTVGIKNKKFEFACAFEVSREEAFARPTGRNKSADAK